jgi:glucarate dehydratase
MLHLGAVVPNLTFSADAHYHHLSDDVIEGGKFEYREGRIGVPDAPGLGSRLNREKLEEHADLYRELGGYFYDWDPGHPGRYAVVPKQRFSDPYADLRPTFAP